MNTAAVAAEVLPIPKLTKLDPTGPAIIIADRTAFIVKGGTKVAYGEFTYGFDDDKTLTLNDPAPGTDYLVWFDPDGAIGFGPKPGLRSAIVIGGFHFAPGGNATARSGGDIIPAINPFSCWDLNWRPKCADPSGMALIEGKFWADIYLFGVDHVENGTSTFAVEIADGTSRPKKTAGKGSYAKLDFATAQEALAFHGKQLPSVTEFFALADGVTERTSADRDPKVTGLDAMRTSHWGINQATGNMWIWGTDGHPEIPRASIFGGSWLDGDNAGSRCAYLGRWAEFSYDDLSARGRSDHLVLV